MIHYKQLVQEDTERFGERIADKVASSVPAPLIKFLKEQVLNTTTGARTIDQMYGLRAQMDAMRGSLEKVHTEIFLMMYLILCVHGKQILDH